MLAIGEASAYGVRDVGPTLQNRGVNAIGLD